MEKYLVNALVVIYCCASPCRAQSPALRTDTWMPDRNVSVITRDGDKVYIGGDFRYIGPANGSFALVDTVAGILRSSFPKVNGTVQVILPDTKGGWYIGGTFTQVGTYQRQKIAHILSDFSVDASWNPGNSHTYHVGALAVDGNKVFAGGGFDTIGGLARKNIACLDAATGSAVDWNPAANGSMAALSISGNRIYAGGDFDTIGGQRRYGIACLDATSGLVTNWNPDMHNSVLRIEPYCAVTAIAACGGTVYVGGLFDTLGGQPRNGIACLDTVTGLATGWNPDARSSNGQGYAHLRALSISENLVYAGGDFDTIGGQPRNGIVCLDATTALAANWNPAPNGSIYALSVSGNTVYTGGYFSAIGGQARINLAALDATTGRATDWSPNANYYVLAIATSNGTVAAGGNCTSIGGKIRKNIACLDAATGQPTDWNPGVRSAGSAVINAITISGGNIFVGGQFDSIGGQARSGIACLDATTGFAVGWNPNAHRSGSSVDPVITALSISGNNIYVGGAFDSIGGQFRNKIARLETTSALATDWNPGANRSVNQLFIVGNVVYAAGDFDTIGSRARKYLAGIDATTGLATDWNPNPNSSVYAIAVSGNNVYTGGQFTAIGGQERNRIACLDATTGLATDWNPGANRFINALILSGTDLYAGGGFTIIGGQERGLIACLDAASARVSDWIPDAGLNDEFPIVHALSVSDNCIWAGGSFTSIGSLPVHYFAQFGEYDPASVFPSRPRSPAGHATIPVPIRLCRSATGICFRYEITAASPVSVNIYNTQGKRIASATEAMWIPGPHQTAIDLKQCAKGFLIVTFKAGNAASTHRILHY